MYEKVEYNTEARNQNFSTHNSNAIRPSFGNVSIIEKRKDSGDQNDEASYDFLKRINENIQKSQQKYPDSHRDEH